MNRPPTSVQVIESTDGHLLGLHLTSLGHSRALNGGLSFLHIRSMVLSHGMSGMVHIMLNYSKNLSNSRSCRFATFILLNDRVLSWITLLFISPRYLNNS